MKYAAVLFIPLLLSAQEREFQTQSRLVLIPTTVIDSKGRFVDHLGAPDFVVLDNGRPRKVAVDSFATGVAPVALVVAVQSSGISSAALEKVRKIGSMIQPLIVGEFGCAALVSFDHQIHWHQECTGDNDRISLAFQRLREGDNKTAHMLDAVHQAIERLQKRANVRRVLLLISESRDRGSETELSTALSAAQSAGVAVYAITYSAFKTAFTTKPKAVRNSRQPLPSREPESPPGREHIPIATPDNRIDILGGIGELARLGQPNTTEILTKGTGGTTLSFARQKGLEEAIEKLGEEMHQQYVLSFPPDNATPGFHRLEVRLANPGRHVVRARPGYWANAVAQ